MYINICYDAVCVCLSRTKVYSTLDDVLSLCTTKHTNQSNNINFGDTFKVFTGFIWKIAPEFSVFLFISRL